MAFLKAKFDVTVELRDKDGNILKKVKGKNLMRRGAAISLARQMCGLSDGRYLNSIAIGNSDIVESAGHIDLQGTSTSLQVDAVKSDDGISMILSAGFTLDQYSDLIVETAIYDQEGDMVARFRLPDAERFTITAGNQGIVRWTFTLTEDTS